MTSFHDIGKPRTDDETFLLTSLVDSGFKLKSILSIVSYPIRYLYVFPSTVVLTFHHKASLPFVSHGPISVKFQLLQESYLVSLLCHIHTKLCNPLSSLSNSQNIYCLTVTDFLNGTYIFSVSFKNFLPDDPTASLENSPFATPWMSGTFRKRRILSLAKGKRLHLKKNLVLSV